MTIQFGFSLTGRGALADREAITMLAQRAEALGYDSVFVTTACSSRWQRRPPTPTPPRERSRSAQIVEDLQAYVAAGAGHFVLDFSVPTPPEMRDVLERFAADVRPRVGAG